MNAIDVPFRQLDDSWAAPLAPVLAAPSTQALKAFLESQRSAGKPIFPNPPDWFAALNLTPLDAVRVVILGQDPYHGDGQAHGLAFSVQPGVRVPPSLRNIYRELSSDLGISLPAHGYLVHWAQQGVLLLNSVLTVEAGRAASHQRQGWEMVTDSIVALVNARSTPTVFMLWGTQAQKKAAQVDCTRHLVLTAAHPSPLSAHGGFFGCRHFSRANAFLVANGRAPIDWSLPEIP